VIVRSAIPTPERSSRFIHKKLNLTWNAIHRRLLSKAIANHGKTRSREERQCSQKSCFTSDELKTFLAMDEPRLNELRALPQYNSAKSSILPETLNVRKRRHFATDPPRRLSRRSGTAVQPVRSFLFGVTPSPREAQFRAIEFSCPCPHLSNRPPRRGFPEAPNYIAHYHGQYPVTRHGSSSLLKIHVIPPTAPSAGFPRSPQLHCRLL
jgi:hypothetical protein